MESTVNWYRVVKLALALFVAETTIGFLEGALGPPEAEVSLHVAGYIASFVVCSAIFAFFAMRNFARPFVHAWLGLLLQVLMGFVFSLLLPIRLDDEGWALIALEWTLLVAALATGTGIGIGVRKKSRGLADT